MHKETPVPEPRSPASSKFILMGFVLVAFLASCATMPYTPSSGSVERLLAAYDGGGYASGKVVATAPFLFDGEILALQSDVDAVWNNLSASGFRFGSARIVSSAPLAPESWSSVASGMEVKTFIAKRLGATCRLFVVESASRRYLLIVDRGSWNRPRLRGFAGPLK